VDGEHTEKAVSKDLRFADKLLNSNGILIVDDFFDKRFPGVTSATFEFISKYNYRIILITDHKAYICRKLSHKINFTKLLNILENEKIQFSSGFGIGNFGESYLQSNEILGYKSILVRNVDNSVYLGNRSKLYRTVNFAKKIIINLSPPVLVKLANRIKL
jgi:hypothetical protein